MQVRAPLRSFSITLAVTILFGISSTSGVYCQTETNNAFDAEQYRNVVRAIARKNYLEAMEQGHKLIERTNKYEQVYSRIVQAAKAAGQLEKAKAMFESLLQTLPPNPRGYYGLGLICVEHENYSAAIEYFKKCFNEQPEFPLALLALVDAYREDKKLIEAEDFLKSLAHTPPDSSVVHLALGYCYARNEQIDAAVKEIDMALSSDPKMIEACYRKAQALTLFGRVKDSLEAIEKCLPPNKDEANEDHQQAFLNLLTDNQLHSGNYAEAFTLSSKALELARTMEDKKYEVASLIYLASIHKMQGNYSQALSSYQQAFAIAKESDRPSSDINLRRYPSWIGDIYYALGDLHSALQQFQLGLEMARKAGDVNLHAVCLSRIGEVFIAWDDHNRAITYYKQLAEIEGGAANALYRISLNDLLSTAYLSTREYQKAEDAIQQTLKLARGLPDFERQLKALNNLGELRLRLNEPEQAINAYHEALQLALDKNSPRHAWRACAGLAMAYRRLEQLDKAREYYQQAIEIMENVRANLGGEEEKAGFFQDKIKVYNDLVAVLMKLHNNDPTKGYNAEAYHIAERGRARAFLDLLAESKVGAEQHPEEALAKRQQEIEARISQLTAQLIAEKSQEPAKLNKKKIAQLEADRDKADLDRQDWLREARQLSSDYKQLKYPEPMRLEQTQKMLDDDTILLSYSLDENESYLFAVSRNAFQVETIGGSAAIRESVEKLVSAIADNTTHSLSKYRQQAVKLYRQLIEPARGMIAGKKELIIAPDGALHRLPFEVLLPPSASRLTQPDFKKLPYLVKDYAISYTPSASVLGEGLDYRRDATAPQKAFVAYADPVYGKDELDTNSNLALVTRGAWQEGKPLKFDRLANSRSEAKGIAALFPEGQADLFLGADATEDNVKAPGRLSQYRMIHFAAHGLLNPNRPRFSGIVLSLPQGAKGDQSSSSKEDGILQSYEIFNLKLNADLVTLSACETGLGKEVNGEGMLSLIRAFMYAGTPSVVASLWNIDDKKSADLMIRFYRHLKGGQVSKARALQQAQIETIGESSSPYFWAPFILMGRSK